MNDNLIADLERVRFGFCTANIALIATFNRALTAQECEAICKQNSEYFRLSWWERIWRRVRRCVRH